MLLNESTVMFLLSGTKRCEPEMMDKTILNCGGGWLSGDACIEALYNSIKVET